MDIILINSENSKISDPDRLLLNLSDKMNLKEEINMLLYQILAWKSIKKSYKNDKCKISALT